MCFFFNNTATTEIYTLSLHDALPILLAAGHRLARRHEQLRAVVEDREADVDVVEEHVRRRVVADVLNLVPDAEARLADAGLDRKSTRLNSSHANISYAVFCLKKKKKK